MDHRRILRDVATCLEHGEIERATYYFAELCEAMRALVRLQPSRVDGSIIHALARLECALNRNDARDATARLVDLEWLLAERVPAGATAA